LKIAESWNIALSYDIGTEREVIFWA